MTEEKIPGVVCSQSYFKQFMNKLYFNKCETLKLKLGKIR